MLDGPEGASLDFRPLSLATSVSARDVRRSRPEHQFDSPYRGFNLIAVAVTSRSTSDTAGVSISLEHQDRGEITVTVQILLLMSKIDANCSDEDAERSHVPAMSKATDARETPYGMGVASRLVD